MRIKISGLIGAKEKVHFPRSLYGMTSMSGKPETRSNSIEQKEFNSYVGRLCLSDPENFEANFDADTTRCQKKLYKILKQLCLI